MNRLRRLRMLIAIAAIGALTVGVQAAVAGRTGQLEGPVVTGGVVLPTSTIVGKKVTQVKIVRQTGAFTEFFTSSETFVNIGFETSITVPAGTKAIILARFSAESACSGGSGYCSIRIRIGGEDGQPVPTGAEFFAFDSSDGDTETGSSWESHAMERSRVLGPGTYVVRVQAAVSDAALSFRLDDANLTVERIKK
jgi:hypothetical protein